jgi:hypothetical protein
MRVASTAMTLQASIPPDTLQITADAALVALLTDEGRRRAMGRHGRDRIAAHDMHGTLVAYERLYAGALGAQRGAAVGRYRVPCQR